VAESTLGIVKPDAFGAGNTGRIIALLEEAGFTVRAAKTRRLARAEAEAFYEVHRGRPFYDELVDFMTSGPCLPMVLDRGDAVAEMRRVIGATDPAEAADGTVRKLFAESKGERVILVA